MLGTGLNPTSNTYSQVLFNLPSYVPEFHEHETERIPPEQSQDN